MKSRYAICLVLVSLFVVQPLRAQNNPSVTAEMAREIVEAFGDRLGETYTFPEDASEVSGHLADRLASGAYDDITQSRALAERLTLDLRAFTDDSHFSVSYDPNRHAAVGSMGLGPNPSLFRFDDDGEPGFPEAGSAAYERILGQFAPGNFGMPKLEVLEGNVGYIEFGIFPPIDLAQATLDAAMTFLGHAEAIIIDLRRVPGGVGGFTPYMASFFFDEPEKLLFTRDFAWAGESLEFRTTDEIGGARRPDVPVWILTSGMTASAAENLSYTLQQHGRATVVGEASRGGAHSSSMVQLAHGFVGQIPIARVVHPVSGSNWQGTGVIPDVPVASRRALEVAHCLAQGGHACEDAGAEPEAVAESGSLGDYEGSYGTRRVFVDAGRLMYQREGGPAIPLLAKSEDRFAFDVPASVRTASNLPDLRFDRRPDGSVYQISTLEADGSVREVFVRD